MSSPVSPSRRQLLMGAGAAALARGISDLGDISVLAAKFSQ